VEQVNFKKGKAIFMGDKVKRQENGNFYINKALYTTCDLNHPHYYFKLRKAIIIPDDKIVSGPINLYIADVPTPLGLPFGFIPNKKDKTANGIVIPTYGESPTLGFFLLGGGYYHKFKNNKLSTSILGDIYSRGSWGLINNTYYKVRYKYSGNFQLNYRQVVQGEKDFDTFSKSADFFIKWNHNQDAKAKPGTTFRASINAGTTTNFQNDYNNVSVNNYLANTFNSNIAWSKQFKRRISSNLNVNLRSQSK
jgi:Organic solvent tolerance protein OstA